MKPILAAVLVFIMLFLLAACGSNIDSNENNPSIHKGDSAQDAKIKLKFGNEEVIAKIYDNPTSRDLLAQLPLTITFEDYAGLEKIGNPTKSLTTEGAPSGADPELGDLALYSPWGNIVIYYGDSKYADGVIILGNIETGAEKFVKMNEKFTITLERMD